MSLYNYEKSSKFSNGINLVNFKNEIENNGNITKNIINIFYTPDTVNIKFDADLSPSEQNILENTIIPNHNYHTTINTSSTYNIITPYIDNSNITAKNYAIASSFIYDGTIFRNIAKIGLLTEMTNDKNLNSNYSIKIYDQTNNNLIKEITGLTNSNKQIVNITNLSNIPTNESIIEIYIKTTNRPIKIYHINVYFE
jgi:hypothetical protein